MLNLIFPIWVPERASPRRPGLNGFTLLELMLVLAIIAMIGAIAAPALGTAFERQKLRAAIETIKLQWEEARLEAMKTGQAQVFTCQLETNYYSIKPLVLQSDAMNAGAGATLMTAGGMVETANMGQGTVAVAANPASRQDKQLEGDISFQSCAAVSDLRAFAVAQEAQMSTSGEVTTQTVPSSVIFYPDGSTSTAEVRIKNPRGDLRILQIRGLTGHCRVIEQNAAVQEDS